MNTLEGKIVLITGASSGIGAGTAKHFASLKCRLSLVGRNQEALNHVAEECREKGAIEVLVLVKDLMAADACRDVVSSTVAHFECNFYLVQLIRFYEQPIRIPNICNEFLFIYFLITFTR